MHLVSIAGRGATTVAEAIRDRWVIGIAVLVLLALIGWLVASRGR
jgi:hypothetical protein